MGRLPDNVGFISHKFVCKKNFQFIVFGTLVCTYHKYAYTWFECVRAHLGFLVPLFPKNKFIFSINNSPSQDFMRYDHQSTLRL